MSEKIIILAGAGEFPLIIARELSKKGVEVSAIAFTGETSKQIEDYSADVVWLEIGNLSDIFSTIAAKKIKKLVLAGKIDHRYLFTKKTDASAVSFLSSLPDTRAESILFALVEELKKMGVTVLPSTVGIEHLFACPGALNNVQLRSHEINDVELGFKIAKGIAALDVGQTVVVKNGTIVAVEALEGTDETIRRAGDLSGPGNVVVKVARPNQDLRFDVPVIGEETLRTMARAKSRVLAVEAGKTLVFNKEEIVRLADENDITVYGYGK